MFSAPIEVLLAHRCVLMAKRGSGAGSPTNVKKRGKLRRAIAVGSFATHSARRLSKGLSKEQRESMLAVARDPDAWGEAISKGWDVTKVEALEAGDAFVTLSRISLGRKTTKEERRIAVEKLALVGTVVIPLRIFMLPGSEMLLGLAAAVMPWRLVPDRWIPFEALRNEPESALPEKKQHRLLRRHRQHVVDALEE